MISCLCVALGGAVGSVARYLVGLIKINESLAFPVKTLAINVAGSFLIGLVAALALKKGSGGTNLVLFLKVGVCGGFTTFSTFALESANLWQGGRPGLAALYVLLSVGASVAAVFAAQACV